MRNERENIRRPAVLWILIALLLFIGIGALISGTMLYSSPDEALMGMSTNLLEDTPFSNYLVPGIVLFIFV